MSTGWEHKKYFPILAFRNPHVFQELDLCINILRPYANKILGEINSPLWWMSRNFEWRK